MQGRIVPEISRFLGIVITMYYRACAVPETIACYRTAGVTAMLPRITAARYVVGYAVWLRFADGSEGIVDLSTDLVGPIFEPLRDQELFARIVLHPELKTLVWPNGADLAPEYLYERLRGPAAA